MPNAKRGFGSLGIIIIILLALGLGAYLWSRKSASTDTANLKTYRNENWKFEFMYPPTWIIETKGNEITLTSSNHKADNIIFSISSIRKETARNINCQPSDSEDINSIVDGFHSAECKNLENANGVRYTRGINTGMSTEQTYKEQILKGYFLNSQESVIIETLLTDGSGNMFPSATSVFDQILSTFRFTK